MKTILKNFFSLSFFLLLLIPVFTPRALAQSPDQEHISSFGVWYIVKSNGVVHVQETLEYVFSTPKHGIFRYIPYVKKNEKGTNLLLTIKDISVSLDGDSSVPFKTTNGGQNVEIKIGDANKQISGKHTYIINYDVYGALTYFDDHDEFYWNVTGNGWTVPISEASAAVSFEPTLTKSDIKIICYTGATGSDFQGCTDIVTSTPNAVAQTKRALNPSEGLTIAVSFPKGKVAQLEPKKDILGSILYIAFIVASALWYVALPVFVFWLYLKENKRVKGKQKILPAWFSPPKNNQGDSYSPAETGYIYSKNLNNKYITATIIQLAQKGLIKIKVKSKNDITFIRNNSSAVVSSFEQDILDGLFSSNNDVESVLKDLKKSTRLAKQVNIFKSHVSQSVKQDKLFKWDPNTFSGIIVTAGMFSLFFTGNILLGLVLLGFMRKAAPRTDLGIEKYSEAASLRNFLVSQNDQLDFQAENQMYFEKLLPYATAFGVEDVWIKRFGNLDIKMPEWYDGDIANFYALSTINNSIAHAIGSSVSYATAKSSSGYSSGFSGGSSGGGGGGGGGGSW